MTTCLVTHPAFLNHLTGQGHPERPDRLRAIERALAGEAFAGLRRIEAPEASREALIHAHPERYVEMIEMSRPSEGLAHLDADTAISPGSWEAAMRAVGGALLAVDEVIGGRARNGFCAARPPGHHAETQRAMGFCLFNNIAIAARHAQRRHGLERGAIIDFDVHHGNGTQEIFYQDPSVLYGSTHQMPLYPGTGAVSETGVGNIFNAPLSPDDGGAAFRSAVEVRILPAIEQFRPDLILVSAGFDAHWRDPLASINLEEKDFVWVTEKLLDAADRHAAGRLVSLLEGGYDLAGLSGSVAAHVAALMGKG